MADDDDLKGTIPDPPPPKGDRRSEAIEAALRRFEARAGKEQQTAPRKAPARGQLAVLASAMLVLLVTVPMLLTQGDDLGRVDTPAEKAEERSPVARQPSAESPAPDGQSQPAADAEAVAIAPEAPPTSDDRQIAPQPAAPLAESSAQGSARAEAAKAPTNDSFAGPEVSASRGTDFPAAASPPAMAPPPPPPPPPPPAAREASLAEADDAAANIVVTGSRIGSSEADRSADRTGPRPTARQLRRWRTCTVADPRKDVGRCGNDEAPGSAELVRGLEIAFRGEDTAALRAFDMAIAREPQAIWGYLNRGLLYRRKDDREAALGDFDRAIHVAPGDARGYYFRSLLLREGGDQQSADRDLRTALRLDNQ